MKSTSLWGAIFTAIAALTGVNRHVSAAEPTWSIALHGGASSLPRDVAPERRQAYQDALTRSLRVGRDVLESGGTSLDAVEKTVMSLEDCPLFNAGRGSVFDLGGGHGMDACIMDGSTLACGGVSIVTRLRNPIRGARLVMEATPHVLLSGEAADRFGEQRGLRVEPLSYFNTERRFTGLQEEMRGMGLTPPETPRGGWSEPGASGDAADEVGDTVGCVALDSHGRLAAATSTGGRNAKMVGRVGDSPVPGAGNYASGAAAVSGTGIGEEFLRYFVAGRVAFLVESGSMSLEEAVDHCLTRVLKPGDGGLIAIDSDGRIVTQTTTEALPRGVADSSGRFEVSIWYD